MHPGERGWVTAIKETGRSPYTDDFSWIVSWKEALREGTGIPMAGCCSSWGCRHGSAQGGVLCPSSSLPQQEKAPAIESPQL